MIALVLAFAAGVFLGFVHFAGLRVLVERLSRSSRPGLLLAAGTAARFVLLGAPLALLTLRLGGAVAAAVAGIVVARTLALRASPIGGSL